MDACPQRGPSQSSQLSNACPGGGMVDTAVLEAAAERCEGSSPFPGTMLRQGYGPASHVDGTSETQTLNRKGREPLGLTESRPAGRRLGGGIADLATRDFALAKPVLSRAPCYAL